MYVDALKLPSLLSRALHIGEGKYFHFGGHYYASMVITYTVRVVYIVLVARVRVIMKGHAWLATPLYFRSSKIVHAFS